MRALSVVHRNALVYRRIWRGSVFSSFLQPALFLLAMGVGVGQLVDRGGAALPNGVSFLEFLAPGLLAAACMQTASFESSWPIAGKMRWQRTYEAVLASPVRIVDVVVGELTWIALRLCTVALAFTFVMTAFGVVRLSARTPLLIAAAVLTGMAFSAPIVAYAATLKSHQNFNVLFRFGITPLFLFSGVFFPITRLPHALQTFAWGTPLFHGVELVRGLALDATRSSTWIAHLVYLLTMFGAGAVMALHTFRRRLYP
jgi:lipooligosaccharide transport system permease protein